MTSELLDRGRRRHEAGATYPFTFNGTRQEVLRTDSQREKVYSAEREVFDRGEVEKFKTRRGFAGRMNRIAKSATATKIRREFGLGKVYGSIDVDLRRSNVSSTSYGGRVEISRSSLDMWTLLHELAHEILPRGIHHHWPFAYAYLKLVSRYMGTAKAKELKAAFRKHKVRMKPKRTRTMTPEQRAQAAERLRLGRIKHESKLASGQKGATPGVAYLQPPVPDFVNKISHDFRI
jgi:hypothetical protein